MPYEGVGLLADRQADIMGTTRIGVGTTLVEVVNTQQLRGSV